MAARHFRRGSIEFHEIEITLKPYNDSYLQKPTIQRKNVLSILPAKVAEAFFYVRLRQLPLHAPRVHGGPKPVPMVRVAVHLRVGRQRVRLTKRQKQTRTTEMGEATAVR